MSEYLLQLKNISKSFPGALALDDVSFKVKKGSIHAVVGENGAGKSTLMKILSGVYPSGTYDGRFLIDNSVCSFNSVRDSEKSGISIIYQELALVEELSVAENIFLGNEISRNGYFNRMEINQKTKKLFSIYGIEGIEPNEQVKRLGVARQQIVEVVKALMKNSRLIIFDEPTAPLSDTETELLFGIIRNLQLKGITCIYISHRLDEVFSLSDTVTVLRDGRHVDTDSIDRYTKKKLITQMVGRELTKMYPRRQHKKGKVVLEVRNWTVVSPRDPSVEILKDINLEIYSGEILGISGLVGSGRTEFVMSLIGAFGKVTKGKLFLGGENIQIKNPNKAINVGINCVTEDRKNEGLILGQSVMKNISLASIKKISQLGFIQEEKERILTNKKRDSLSIKCASMSQMVSTLSGGNQQKVVIAKWLLSDPKVLILDEPTRGIDVGAKVEIYEIMNELVDQGVAIVMISSDLMEIMGISDRIAVMNEGRIDCTMNIQDATQEKILAHSIGCAE
jgi:ABC-type sugar transport system ATPase subunit